MGKFFRKVHIYLSLFFLPLALLYAITGIAYLSGINQDSGAKIEKFEIAMPQSKEEIPQVVRVFLEEKGLELPSSFEPQKAKGGGIMFGGIDYNVVAEQKDQTLSLTLTNRTLLGDMIMLHKGKGKWFNILGYGFGSALVIFYLSGLVMTSFCNRRRVPALIAVGLGFLVTLVLGYASL